MIYDLAVLGLGGMGSATAAHAAARGARVIGIEQFARGHTCGASSGRSRIIRKAYFEDAAYVPLLRRAYALWSELERTSGMQLLDLVGVMMAGLPDSAAIAGTLRSASEHGLELETYDASAAARRFRGIVPRAGEVVLFERDAGVVFPEAGIAAHLQQAEACCAQLVFDLQATAYAAERDGIRVTLADGTTVLARALALCAGPWLKRVAGELDLPLRIQRNVQVWFAPAVPSFSRDRFPAFFTERDTFPAPLYGFPDFGDGVKAALHGFGETTEAALLDREIRPADIVAVRDALEDWMPGAAATFAFGKACMYALTPDQHFIVDRHPDDARIVIAGGFSGHGYKFCPVIGEIVADLALEGGTAHPIAFLRRDRERLAASQ
jgi:sarcosine oxidase